MIQKSVAVVLMVVGMSSSLYATNVFKNIMKPKGLTNHSNQSETDFSGTWSSAKCMGKAITLKIDQTPDSISINDGEPMEIGTMVTKSNSGKRFGRAIITSSDSNALEWNAEKTELTMRGISVSKNFAEESDDDEKIEARMHINIDVHTFALENGQLKLKMNTVEFLDLQRIDLAHPTCVFTKVE